MHIDIVGAGGIGVALAYVLDITRATVRLIESDQNKLEAGQQNGIAVAGLPNRRIPLVAFRDWLAPADAAVLLCCKTYDNAAVLEKLDPATFLVPVQNGFAPALDAHRHAAEGIASFVSECDRDRPVTRITRDGELHIGPRRSVSDAERHRIEWLTDLLVDNSLFPVRSVDDVLPFKATKLMYNAAISPLAAAAGVDNGALITDPLVKRLFFGLLRENYAILKHAQIPLAKIGPFHPDTVDRILRNPGLASLLAIFFRPSLRGTYCSMAPDIGTGRTEIDAYNGHLIRLAGEFPAPFNRAAHALIERIVDNRLPPAYGHLESLRELLSERPS